MIGKLFVTSTGYDPEQGKHVKDPYLGPTPSLGACRPDIRRVLQPGDHIFVVSGKVPGADQFVIGGFEIAEKITATEAYHRFPEQRLSLLPDGQVTGNVIVNGRGKQHKLDHHEKLDGRLANYVVGRNPVVLQTPGEIAEGRRRTLEMLRDVFQAKGDTIRALIGRCRNLTEKQVLALRAHLTAVKVAAGRHRPVEELREFTRTARKAS